MSNLFKGFVCLALGAVLWILTSVVGGFLEAFGEASLTLEYLMYIGFAIMVLGPIIFWIIIPIKNRLPKKKR
jgi:hypothetical protein